VWWLVVLFQWFRQASHESEGGLYGYKVDLSYRWSMSWFIFSEVMFFAAFFGALYWARVHSVPALGSLDNALLWPDFKAVWPSVAAGHHRLRRPARRAFQPPWALSGRCPPSTPRCC
jgi:cytochrome c oxidase subunit 3